MVSVLILCRPVVGLTEGSCTGVLMKLVKGSPMADKPNHESLLRCRWPEGLTLSSASIAKIAKDVAAALEYLHSQGMSMPHLVIPPLACPSVAL